MGTFEISVRGQFAAQHQLSQPGGGLEPLHEHTWQVEVTYGGPRLDELGLLTDFVRLRQRLGAVLATLDGQNLNRTPALAGRSPSAEIVALSIAQRLAEQPPAPVALRCVAVEEAPGCTARYFPDL